MEIDGWTMADQFWKAFVDGLNLLIPIVMPDGTKVGATIFFATIGIFAALLSGKKINDIRKKIFDDLTN